MFLAVSSNDLVMLSINSLSWAAFMVVELNGARNLSKGYYTEETSEEDNGLFYNPWEEVISPAIYLTNIEEVPTKEDTEANPTIEKQIEKFLQNDALDKEEKERQKHFFRKKETYLPIICRVSGKPP
ncbi:18510_t:CDS:2 [Racocetra persica]|uniref:18510_t:CDS:1 n=1 Tax=Racocetra persica TaxID=160502 RepID=A0ACA9REP7_9GLOM|nr:18510_t:CDS:2 [Racocetra persica]